MNPMLYVRKQVLGLTQGELAEIAQVSQPTVSKWEDGTLKPDLAELGRIRDAAQARGLKWDDRWFFEAPTLAPDVQGDSVPTEAQPEGQ
jgi:transcriptional regulator with XRE-family HTH domain